MGNFEAPEEWLFAQFEAGTLSIALDLWSKIDQKVTAFLCGGIIKQGNVLLLRTSSNNWRVKLWDKLTDPLSSRLIRQYEKLEAELNGKL